MKKQETERKDENNLNKLNRKIKAESRIDVLKQGTMSIRINCFGKDGCGY